MLLQLGLGKQGLWVQVIDEPNWMDNATAVNTMTLIQHYKQLYPGIQVFQTRFPCDTSLPSACVGDGDTPSSLVNTHAIQNPDVKKGQDLTTKAVVPSQLTPLLDMVDWWCPHVCQVRCMVQMCPVLVV